MLQADSCTELGCSYFDVHTLIIVAYVVRNSQGQMLYISTHSQHVLAVPHSLSHQALTGHVTSTNYSIDSFF